MRYMLMMFGTAGEMMETQDPTWIREMIAFMIQIDKDLEASGELVFQAGLADGDTAKTVRVEGGVPVATDGPLAEAKESLVGYWVLDVANEARAIEIAGQIAVWSGQVEIRQVHDAPPEI